MTLAINEVHEGDCLELMKDIPDKSIDMILCDLPYGTTACKWDTIIPFDELWEQYGRVVKDDGAIVLTASQPFTSALVMSNPKLFRHSWVWDKENAGNFATARFGPLKVTEDVCVFSKKGVKYNPQMIPAKIKNMRPRNKEYERLAGNSIGMASGVFRYKDNHNESKRYPKNILKYNNREGELNALQRVHPTQKPVPLLEYLILTYTNEYDVILDNCIGSGTTAVAAINTNRNYIGIEREPEYVAIARQRINVSLQTKVDGGGRIE